VRVVEAAVPRFKSRFACQRRADTTLARSAFGGANTAEQPLGQKGVTREPNDMRAQALPHLALVSVGICGDAKAPAARGAHREPERDLKAGVAMETVIEQHQRWSAVPLKVGGNLIEAGHGMGGGDSPDAEQLRELGGRAGALLDDEDNDRRERLVLVVGSRHRRLAFVAYAEKQGTIRV